eukprot:PhF_6_TR30371/c0_g2_i1/m.44488
MLDHIHVISFDYVYVHNCSAGRYGGCMKIFGFDDIDVQQPAVAVYVTNSVFQYCKAKSMSGGCVSIENLFFLTVKNTSFSNSESYKFGGCVHTSIVNVTKFINNSMTSCRSNQPSQPLDVVGGGCWCPNVGEEMYAENIRLTDCYASYGGAILSGALRFLGVNISITNSSSVSGIWSAYTSKDYNITGLTMINNVVSSGLIHLDLFSSKVNLTLRNTVIESDSTFAFFNNFSSVVIQNTRFVGGTSSRIFSYASPTERVINTVLRFKDVPSVTLQNTIVNANGHPCFHSYNSASTVFNQVSFTNCRSGGVYIEAGNNGITVVRDTFIERPSPFLYSVSPPQCFRSESREVQIYSIKLWNCKGRESRSLTLSARSYPRRMVPSQNNGTAITEEDFVTSTTVSLRNPVLPPRPLPRSLPHTSISSIESISLDTTSVLFGIVIPIFSQPMMRSAMLQYDCNVYTPHSLVIDVRDRIGIEDSRVAVVLLMSIVLGAAIVADVTVLVVRVIVKKYPMRSTIAPACTVRCFLVFFTPMTRMGIDLVSTPQQAQSFTNAGVLTLLVSLVGFCTLSYHVLRDNTNALQYHNPVREKANVYYTYPSLKSLLVYWLGCEGIWSDKDERYKYYISFGHLVDLYQPLKVKFAFVELCASLVTGVMLGIQLKDESSCRTLYYVMLPLCLVYVALVIWVKPHHTPRDRHATLVSACIFVGIVIFNVLHRSNLDNDESDQTSWTIIQVLIVANFVVVGLNASMWLAFWY